MHLFVESNVPIIPNTPIFHVMSENKDVTPAHMTYAHPMCSSHLSLVCSRAQPLTSTSLGRVLQHPFCFWLMHVEMYQISTILSWSELWPLLQLRTKLRPHHGGQRLWPIPSPGACRRPSPARRCHPHTMGDATYTWFWRNPSGGRVARATTTTSKMLIFESMLNYRIIH